LRPTWDICSQMLSKRDREKKKKRGGRKTDLSSKYGGRRNREIICTNR
jgi:hypothetical protein